jgi:hypothetical protein
LGKVIEVHNPMVVTSMNSGGTTPGGAGSIGDKHSTTIVVSKTIDVSRWTAPVARAARLPLSGDTHT